MKLFLLALLCLVSRDLFNFASTTPRRLQRSREGCRICGRKSDEQFLQLPSNTLEKKDVRETFSLARVQEGEICKTCHRSVARYKATGKKATPRVSTSVFHSSDI